MGALLMHTVLRHLWLHRLLERRGGGVDGSVENGEPGSRFSPRGLEHPEPGREERAEALGANVEWHVLDEYPHVQWTTLSDPEGNLFCIAEHPPTS